MTKADEVIRAIHEINELREAKLEEGRPTVGMFYVFPEDMWDGRVYSVPEPLETAYEADGIKTHNMDHSTWWGLIKGTVPEFKNLKYDHYPRGRIMYDTNTRKFEIRIDPCVAKDKRIIKKVASDMRLRAGTYTVNSDNSYHCKDCKV